MQKSQRLSKSESARERRAKVREIVELKISNSDFKSIKSILLGCCSKPILIAFLANEKLAWSIKWWEMLIKSDESK